MSEMRAAGGIPRLDHPLGRRRFLALAAIAPAIALTACTRREDRPAPVAPSPAVVPPAGPSPSPAVSTRDLDEFLAVSALLTGFEKQNLDPDLGRIYLQSLHARPDPALTLTDFYDQIGFRSADPPRSLQDLESGGALDPDQPRTLANTIVAYWYSGIYNGANGPDVATFRDALAWKAIGFAFAPSTCLGSPGVWGQPPRETVA